MDRRQFLAASLASWLPAPGASEAQPSFKLPRVGFLGLSSQSSLRNQTDAFRAGLRDLGYVEGKSIVIEYRWADGEYERLSQLAGELVRLRVDVLVTHGTPGGFAAKRATTTIPIVIATSADAVASGLVRSLARPGGNVTGLTFFVPELNGKRLEIFKELLPHAGRMAVLVNPDNPAMGPIMRAMERTASALRVGLQQYPVRGLDQFDEAVSAMIRNRMDAVTVIEDPMFQGHSSVLARQFSEKRLPSLGYSEFALTGGLVGYGIDIVALFRRAASFVARILKGAAPADLPVERPTKFELVLNLKTAKILGLRIPPSLLARADQVIE